MEIKPNVRKSWIGRAAAAAAAAAGGELNKMGLGEVLQHVLELAQGCQTVYLHTWKYPILVSFLKALEYNFLVYFMAVW
jgi:predicted regulator of Ras-like GTPase activity (Roadblock/LC7/MglB family)